MPSVTFVLVAVAGYLLGSIPCGVIVTQLFAGEDVRQMGSGRTGSTNVMRVVGWKLGLLTGILDTLKAASAVWLAEWLLPGSHWAGVVAGLAAGIGHLYSIFIGFKGGAGGGPTVGGGGAMWPWAAAFVIPLGPLVWEGVGYASGATIFFSLIIIAVVAGRKCP